MVGEGGRFMVLEISDASCVRTTLTIATGALSLAVMRTVEDVARMLRTGWTPASTRSQRPEGPNPDPLGERPAQPLVGGEFDHTIGWEDETVAAACEAGLRQRFPTLSLVRVTEESSEPLRQRIVLSGRSPLTDDQVHAALLPWIALSGEILHEGRALNATGFDAP
jgi:hypothetical protein